MARDVIKNVLTILLNSLPGIVWIPGKNKLRNKKHPPKTITDSPNFNTEKAAAANII